MKEIFASRSINRYLFDCLCIYLEIFWSHLYHICDFFSKSLKRREKWESEHKNSCILSFTLFNNKTMYEGYFKWILCLKAISPHMMLSYSTPHPNLLPHGIKKLLHSIVCILVYVQGFKF